MNILAIESSCDETAAAVVTDGIHVAGSAIATSADMHKKYGGIVPEVAAREQVKSVLPVIKEALSASGYSFDAIDAVAVTTGPGLIGSLLVGVETAKTIARVYGLPVIPVNHVLAHMYANFIAADQNKEIQSTGTTTGPIPGQISHIAFPAVSLVVSGGHTELYLMKSANTLTWLGGTLDDAAGEAFDKTARLLGFENRGGPAIQESAKQHNPRHLTLNTKLPRPMLDKDNECNFSFSGLKTAILREVNSLKANRQFTKEAIAHLSHEVQESITDVLVKKTINAARAYEAKSILLSGGVAANIRLREKCLQAIQTDAHMQCTLHVPPVRLCTDNAEYIGSYAFFRGKKMHWRDVTADPELSVEV